MPPFSDEAPTRSERNAGKPNYKIETMDLGQIVFVMCEHYVSFEQQRNMTLAEIATVFEGINAGTIKSVREETLQQKQMREVALSK